MNNFTNAIPLIVTENEARDNARKIARLEPDVMGELNVSDGDLIEVISQLKREIFTCLALLPTDTSEGVIRLDYDSRTVLGAKLGDKIFVKRADSRETEMKISTVKREGKISVETSAVLIAGSCIDFENERHKIMDYLNTLEMEVHMKSDYKCYSAGKKTLGWDFFQISLPMQLVEKILQIHPEIDKQEGITLEERFVIWLSNRMKKRQLEYHLKISEIPFESVSGFRLDPKNYHDTNEMGDLK